MEWIIGDRKSVQTLTNEGVDENSEGHITMAYQYDYHGPLTPVTPIHSPDPSSTSVGRTRPPGQLSLHEYRKMQATPDLPAIPGQRSIKKKRGLSSLGCYERLPAEAAIPTLFSSCPSLSTPPLTPSLDSPHLNCGGAATTNTTHARPAKPESTDTEILELLPAQAPRQTFPPTTSPSLPSLLATSPPLLSTSSQYLTIPTYPNYSEASAPFTSFNEGKFVCRQISDQSNSGVCSQERRYVDLLSSGFSRVQGAERAKSTSRAKQSKSTSKTEAKQSKSTSKTKAQHWSSPDASTSLLKSFSPDQRRSDSSDDNAEHFQGHAATEGPFQDFNYFAAKLRSQSGEAKIEVTDTKFEEPDAPRDNAASSHPRQRFFKPIKHLPRPLSAAKRKPPPLRLQTSNLGGWHLSQDPSKPTLNFSASGLQLDRPSLNFESEDNHERSSSPSILGPDNSDERIGPSPSNPIFRFSGTDFDILNLKTLDDFSDFDILSEIDSESSVSETSPLAELLKIGDYDDSDTMSNGRNPSGQRSNRRYSSLVAAFQAIRGHSNRASRRDSEISRVTQRSIDREAAALEETSSLASIGNYPPWHLNPDGQRISDIDGTIVTDSIDAGPDGPEQLRRAQWRRETLASISPPTEAFISEEAQRRLRLVPRSSVGTNSSSTTYSPIDRAPHRAFTEDPTVPTYANGLVDRSVIPTFLTYLEARDSRPPDGHTNGPTSPTPTYTSSHMRGVARPSFTNGHYHGVARPALTNGHANAGAHPPVFNGRVTAASALHSHPPMQDDTMTPRQFSSGPEQPASLLRGRQTTTWGTNGVDIGNSRRRPHLPLTSDSDIETWSHGTEQARSGTRSNHGTQQLRNSSRQVRNSPQHLSNGLRRLSNSSRHPNNATNNADDSRNRRLGFPVAFTNGESGLRDGTSRPEHQASRAEESSSRWSIAPSIHQGSHLSNGMSRADTARLRNGTSRFESRDSRRSLAPSPDEHEPVRSNSGYESDDDDDFFMSTRSSQLSEPFPYAHYESGQSTTVEHLVNEGYMNRTTQSPPGHMGQIQSRNPFISGANSNLPGGASGLAHSPVSSFYERRPPQGPHFNTPAETRRASPDWTGIEPHQIHSTEQLNTIIEHHRHVPSDEITAEDFGARFVRLIIRYEQLVPGPDYTRWAQELHLALLGDITEDPIPRERPVIDFLREQLEDSDMSRAGILRANPFRRNTTVSNPSEDERWRAASADSWYSEEEHAVEEEDPVPVFSPLDHAGGPSNRWGRSGPPPGHGLPGPSDDDDLMIGLAMVPPLFFNRERFTPSEPQSYDSTGRLLRIDPRARSPLSELQDCASKNPFDDSNEVGRKGVAEGIPKMWAGRSPPPEKRGDDNNSVAPSEGGEEATEASGDADEWETEPSQSRHTSTMVEYQQTYGTYVLPGIGERGGYWVPPMPSPSGQEVAHLPGFWPSEELSPEPHDGYDEHPIPVVEVTPTPGSRRPPRFGHPTGDIELAALTLHTSGTTFRAPSRPSVRMQTSLQRLILPREYSSPPHLVVRPQLRSGIDWKDLFIWAHYAIGFLGFPLLLLGAGCYDDVLAGRLTGPAKTRLLWAGVMVMAFVIGLAIAVAILHSAGKF